jgi:5'-methylthioinosine phosphorylase
MLGIIGGSGLDHMPGLVLHEQIVCDTPFGETSAPLVRGEGPGGALVFLPRHGVAHNIPPHKINYRANIWALKQQGVDVLVGVAAVGGISATMRPGTLVIPSQILDYTHGREHSFHDGEFLPVEHMEFAEPYCASLRQQLLKAAACAGAVVLDGGCYGVTQGPRLETSAEIGRMARDGADMVGMTAMPEAALAREAGLCYANCAIVTNWAAGVGDIPVSMTEINQQLEECMGSVLDILTNLQMDTLI